MTADSTDLIVFTGSGASRNNCNPGSFIDKAMRPYLASFNGTTKLTLVGGPASAHCPPTTFAPLSNIFSIGGMTVPGNATLDRTKYDNNTFYFSIADQENKDIEVAFQSSTDYYADQTQPWRLKASKAGDGYDISGNWTGTLPDDGDYVSFPGVPGDECWDHEKYWLGAKGSDNQKWVLNGHVSPVAAQIDISMTLFGKDGVVWNVCTNFTGKASSSGPRLVTTGSAPTTDAHA